jgi:AcrR family transcriptional regulator
MGGQRKPKQLRGIETQTQILTAGFDLFGRKGLHGTNSREIAAAAGVSVGSFYTYYKDKRQLFIELIHAHCGDILEVLNRFRVEEHLDDDPRGVVHRLIATIWDLHDAVYPLNQKAITLRETDPEIAHIIDEQERAIAKRLLALLTAVVPRLRVRDMETAAWLVVRIIIGVMLGVSRAKPSAGKERMVEEMTDVICRYLFI